MQQKLVSDLSIILVNNPKQSLSIDKISKNKRGLEQVTVAIQVTKQVPKNSYISYVLSDQVSWCNIKWFLSYSNLWKPIYDINYSTSICPFKLRKCGKEGKKLQTFEYLENKKSFFDAIKNIFHSFWRPIIWWKNKNLIKNSGHKL